MKIKVNRNDLVSVFRDLLFIYKLDVKKIDSSNSKTRPIGFGYVSSNRHESWVNSLTTFLKEEILDLEEFEINALQKHIRNANKEIIKINKCLSLSKNDPFGDPSCVFIFSIDEYNVILEFQKSSLNFKKELFKILQSKDFDEGFLNKESLSNPDSDFSIIFKTWFLKNDESKSDKEQLIGWKISENSTGVTFED